MTIFILPIEYSMYYCQVSKKGQHLLHYAELADRQFQNKHVKANNLHSYRIKHGKQCSQHSFSNLVFSSTLIHSTMLENFKVLLVSESEVTDLWEFRDERKKNFFIPLYGKIVSVITSTSYQNLNPIGHLLTILLCNPASWMLL